MQLSAILHRPLSEYAFATDETHLVFRLRTAREALAVTFYYADRAAMTPSLTFRSLPMPCVRTDSLYNWYEVCLETKLPRIAYYFVLEDRSSRVRYAGDLLEDPASPIARSDYFQYAFNHRADLPRVPDWVHDAVVYNLFPDSFADGPCRLKGPGKVCEVGGFPSVTRRGGTLRGILESLNYIQFLGCNCLYLNPIFGADSYHKYDLIDYRHIDPCFGTDEDFRDLVREAHRLGIRIIIDGVFNHVSSHHFSFQDVLQNGKASEYYDWFYHLPEHPALPGPGEEVDYTCFAYVPNMPKTDTSCPALRAYFCDIGRYWLREYDVDGWRLDVANEVDDGFLRAFRQAVREVKPDALILGEIWENASHWLQGDMMDGAMNYDFRRFCLQFFATGSLSAEAFDVHISYLLMRYRAQMLPALLNLLDGHDVPRFLSLCGGDLNRMALAVVFQMTFIGMPSVFYGDEKGMTGIAEDEYRSPMSWDEASPLETLYRDLIALRRAHPALTRGTFRTLRAAGKLYVFLREEGGERITVALHAGDGSESVEICGEILLQKGFSCGILSSYSYVIARSVADGDHDL